MLFLIRSYMLSTHHLSCISLLLLLVLSVSSCGSDDPIVEQQPTVEPEPTPTQPEENPSHYLNVVDTLLVDYPAGNSLLAINADTSYIVEADCDWLRIELVPSDRYVQLNLLANETDEERSTMLKVKSDAGLEHTVLVKQDFPTRVVSTEYKIANDLLDEKNVAWLKLNRKVESISTPEDSSKPQVELLTDSQTVEVSGLRGFGSDYTCKFKVNVGNGHRHSMVSEIWLCDEHWRIEGRLVGYTVRDTKPDYGFAITETPNQLYGFNSYHGNPYFSNTLAYRPTAISYCALTDEVYVSGDDQALHVYDANDGTHHRDIALPASRNYGTYCRVVITDQGLGLVVSSSNDRYLFDASRNDTVYILPQFENWASYREMKPSIGPDGKIWFSTNYRQLYRIESAEGPVVQPADIDASFDQPDVYQMGGVWVTYVWKPGQNKVLISAAPGSQTVFDFDTNQYDFHTKIESRCKGGLAFDITQPSSVDRLWWVRKIRFSGGTGRDFLIVEDKKIIFWSEDTNNELSMIRNQPDGKTMVVALEQRDNPFITYFATFDVEKFNAKSSFRM